MSDAVRNSTPEWRLAILRQRKLELRAAGKWGGFVVPDPQTLARKRGELYRRRAIEIAAAYWQGMRDEIRNDTMGDIADEIRREFNV